MLEKPTSSFCQFDHLPSDLELKKIAGRPMLMNRIDIKLSQSGSRVSVGLYPKIFRLSVGVILAALGLSALAYFSTPVSKASEFYWVIWLVIVPMTISGFWIVRHFVLRQGPAYLLDSAERTITLCRVNKVVPASDVTAISLLYGILNDDNGASNFAELRILITDGKGGYQLYPLVIAIDGDFRARSIDDLAKDLSQTLGAPIWRVAEEDGQPASAEQHFPSWKKLFRSGTKWFRKQA